MKKSLFSILVVLLAACSDSTGPKEENVSGAWSYNATNLSGGGLSCSITGVTMTVSQSGTTFSGTYSPGTLSCGSLGSTNFTGGTVVTGKVTGSGVSFNFDTQDWMHNGLISGNSISGTTTMRLVLTGGQTLVMTGNFALAKN